MKHIVSILAGVGIILTSCFSFAANKVVVIPLNSSSPVYVAGTEITALPYTISSSGFYFITQDLTCTTCTENTHGINVTVDNVTLDLMGFSLVGPGGTGILSHGIYLNVRSNVEIRNGTVRDFPANGIRGDGGIGNGGHRVFNIRAFNNDDKGIQLVSEYNIIEGCTAVGNTSTGISTGAGSTVTGNIAYNNGGSGISAGRSTVTNNSCRNNTGYGITCPNGDSYVANNTLTGNTTGNLEACANCTFGANHAP